MNDLQHIKQKILIMGDFNLHVEREDDPGAFQFRKTLQAPGLR